MKIKFVDKLFFLLGVFSTITILQFRIGSFSLTFFNATLYIIVLTKFICMIKNNYKIRLNKDFTMFVIIILVSTLVNLTNHIGSDWINTSIKITINFVCFYLPFYFLMRKEDINYSKILFFKGLYFSSCLQLIWELLQIFFWYLYKISLNDRLFNQILGISPGDGWTWNQYDLMGTFRFTGLGWQASNLALCLIIGYILSPNLIFKVVFAIGILLSTSRVGIVVLVFCVLISLIDSLIHKKFLNIFKSLNKINISSLMMIFLFPVILIVIFMMFSKNLNIINNISDTFNKTIQRLNESSQDMHMMYYLRIPDIFSKDSFMRIMLGYGMGCAGYPFSLYYNIYSNSGPWIPETDIVSILLNVGVIGFIFYYKWYLTALFKRRKNRTDFILLISILLAGIFYAFMNSWVLIVIMFCMLGRELEIKDLFKNIKKVKNDL